MMKLRKYCLIFLLSLLLCVTNLTVFASSSQLQSGQKLYEAGKYAEAVNVLTIATTEFRNKGNRLSQAIALSNLSLAYQQLGELEKAGQAISQSLELLQKSSSVSSDEAQIIAQSLDVQGKLQFIEGKVENAISTWKKASEIYVKLDDKTAITRNQINQVQALQALGQLWQANKTLELVKADLVNLQDSPLKATGLLSLGNTLRLIGEFDLAEENLNKTIKIAENLKLDRTLGDAYLSLGNTFRARRDAQLTVGNDFDVTKTQEYVKSAIFNYQKASQAISNPSTQLQAILNLLNLLVSEKKLLAERKLPENKNLIASLGNYDKLLAQIQSLITKVHNSRSAIYARINFADSLLELANDAKQEKQFQSMAYAYTQEALKQARELTDKRAESYALGTLGEIYEKSQQLDNAEKLTQQALAIAISIDAKDITYQWQWQLGRLHLKHGNIPEATKVYGLAIATLDSLRNDLVAINSDVQFSFREKVEPVYREYVNLLLRGNEQNNLIKARKVLESLQLAELNNFFRVACLKPIVNIDEEVDRKNITAAIIYPIILPDRIEVILKLPDQQELYRYTSVVEEKEVEKSINDLRTEIEEKKLIDKIPSSQKLYNQLIKPAEALLKQHNIKTLTFVLDGVLRNIPVAALYDGKQPLIEKYSIAISPTLQLFELKSNLQSRALVAGLSEKSENFSKLEYVREELDDIKAIVRDNKELFNDKFTKKNLENKLNSEPFPIVHIATHGQFSSDPNETFILGHQNEKIKLADLKQWLRSREELRPDAIELLVLSACKTASGDKRAALGIAGVAIQAGARSTVASLWNANDLSTAALMRQFYKELVENKVSKAEALQRAQLALFKEDEKPYFWASFILIGNWL